MTKIWSVLSSHAFRFPDRRKYEAVVDEGGQRPHRVRGSSIERDASGSNRKMPRRGSTGSNHLQPRDAASEQRRKPQRRSSDFVRHQLHDVTPRTESIPRRKSDLTTRHTRQRSLSPQWKKTASQELGSKCCENGLDLPQTMLPLQYDRRGSTRTESTESTSCSTFSSKDAGAGISSSTVMQESTRLKLESGRKQEVRKEGVQQETSSKVRRGKSPSHTTAARGKRLGARMAARQRGRPATSCLQVGHNEVLKGCTLSKEKYENEKKEIPEDSFTSSGYILVNRERKTRGLMPLERSILLDRVAGVAAKEMADAFTIIHLDMDQLARMIEDEKALRGGEEVEVLGENSGSGVCVNAVHAKFMSDEMVESENILDCRFTAMGVGTARRTNKDGVDVVFVSQLFMG